MTWLTIPLAAPATTTVSASEQERYLGVQVVNEGLVPVTVDAVGIDFDVESADYPGYQFPLDDSLYFPPRRLEGKSSAAWPAHISTVKAGILKIIEDHARVPSRFRPYVLPGAGERVEGEWVSALLLPIWKSDMTEERLQDMLATAAEVRRRASYPATP